MNIIDHGVWIKYKPATLPFGVPANSLFAKRTSDGVDWYDYVRPHFEMMQPPKPKIFHPETGEEMAQNKKTLTPNFKPGSVMCNVYWHPDLKQNIVATAVYDPTLLFPADQQVIEIVGYQGNDPHKDFGGKVYDKDAATFSPLVRPDPQPSKTERSILTTLDKIMERLEKLEKQKG
jgi:hypothetical protein